MPSVETNARSFKTLIRVRTLCLALIAILLWVAEGAGSSGAVLAGWQLLLAAAVLSLVFGVLAKAKRIAGILLPLVFLVDSLLVGAWVCVSGGAVSFYLPFFLLLIVSATMVLTPRKAAVVIPTILVVFLTSLYLSFLWDIPGVFEAGRMNFIASVLEVTPAPVRRGLYGQQALRWVFFFLMMVVVCVWLMREVWAREEKLRIRERSLEQKRHLIQMGELTGRLAHGVNTPLGLISGNLEMLLAETRKGGKTHKKLSQIDQYVQRAIRTVRDVLDYGRQSMSEIRPAFLPQIIQSVVAAVQPKLKRSEGKLILDVDPGLPPVLAYPEGLFQALLNLVENAIDSIPPGGLITLSARFQYRTMRLSAEDRRGEIRLVVRDTGKGIPADGLKRIFEPFYSTKGFGRGTGLGLSIVKRIMDEHQGGISVESKVGQGTQFVLTLPADGHAGEGGGKELPFDYNEK